MLQYFLTLIGWWRTAVILHGAPSKTLFKEGEIWWCSIGINIGVEIYGKGKRFTRPVIIFKKFNANSFLGIPLTSRAKEGRWYFPITQGGKTNTAILSQIRTFDSKRLVKRLTTLSDESFAKVTDALSTTYGLKNIHPASCEAGIGGKSQ